MKEKLWLHFSRSNGTSISNYFLYKDYFLKTRIVLQPSKFIRIIHLLETRLKTHIPTTIAVYLDGSQNK